MAPVKTRSSYVMFRTGDNVMPATLEDHRDIRQRSGFAQISASMEVIDIRQTERSGGTDRHYHPQEVQVRVHSGDQHCDIWVSGRTVDYPPTRQEIEARF